jgi:hypothetical protein
MNRNQDFINLWSSRYLSFKKDQIDKLLKISKKQKRNVGENGFVFTFERPSDLSFESLIVINGLDEANRKKPVESDAVEKGIVIEYTAPIVRAEDSKKIIISNLNKGAFDFEYEFDVIFFPEEQIDFLLNKVISPDGGICFYGIASAFQFLSEEETPLVYLNILAFATEDVAKPIDVKGHYSFKFGLPCPPAWPPQAIKHKS